MSPAFHWGWSAFLPFNHIHRVHQSGLIICQTPFVRQGEHAWPGASFVLVVEVATPWDTGLVAGAGWGSGTSSESEHFVG